MIEQIRLFIKRNKADNLQIKSGWHERLQTIYVHHQSQQKPSGLKNLQTKSHFEQSEKSAVEKFK
jgi:hypothetical protein